MITVEEAKKCMSSGTSIFYKDIEYARISALTFRKTSGKFSVFVELLDKNKNSVYIVPIEFLEKENITDNIIDLAEFTKIKIKSEQIKDYCCLLFNNLECGKFEISKNQINYLKKQLSNLENILEEINNVDENL